TVHIVILLLVGLVFTAWFIYYSKLGFYFHVKTFGDVMMEILVMGGFWLVYWNLMQMVIERGS
ncbi:MAG: hypothetical protein AAF639_18505, partial [Chloroflexota bacterium]